MTKKMPLALALALFGGLAVAAPPGACADCGPAHHGTHMSHARPVAAPMPAARYHYTASYAAPVVRQPVCAPVVRRPVCQPVCDPCYDPCRRSGLLGLGILGIL